MLRTWAISLVGVLDLVFIGASNNNKKHTTTALLIFHRNSWHDTRVAQCFPSSTLTWFEYWQWNEQHWWQYTTRTEDEAKRNNKIKNKDKTTGWRMKDEDENENVLCVVCTNYVSVCVSLHAKCAFVTGVRMMLIELKGYQF